MVGMHREQTGVAEISDVFQGAINRGGKVRDGRNSPGVIS
jgi:hypothetical protein